MGTFASIFLANTLAASLTATGAFEVCILFFHSNSQTIVVLT
jgi:hypothetical protein